MSKEIQSLTKAVEKLTEIINKGGGYSYRGGSGSGGIDSGNKNDTEIQSELSDLEEKRVKNIRDYAYQMDRVRSIQRDIKDDSAQYSVYMNKLKKQVKQLERTKKELAAADQKLQELKDRYNTATEEEKKQLEEILKLEIARVQVLKDEVYQLSDSNNEIAEALKRSNKLKGIWKSMGNDMDKIGAIASKIGKIIGISKILDWEKAFRATQLSMGLSEQATEAFSSNITDAAMVTNKWGHTIKELAEMQGQYSDELGRATMMSEETMIHMSAVAKATGLGTEGAAKFAAEMDKVGFGAGKTAEYIDQAMMDATSMGLNSTKVIKNLSSNLKLLNKYNFKGGSKGLKQMAENATKMGVEMDMVAGMADKLFDIEGAVEMSAQLQVLGGEWSKLADPFKLMYMARNDMKGLQESIINATISTAEFNAQTGEIEIQAMEMHRLKKVAEATGLEFDQLATAAKNAAKFAAIRKQMKFGGFDKKTMEFIENAATLNEKGEAVIMIEGKEKFVKDLDASSQNYFDKEVQFRKDAAKRAAESRALDEKYEDIKNQFATMFFPLIVRFSGAAERIKDAIMNFINNHDVIDGIKNLAKSIASVVETVGKFIASWPTLTLGIVGALGGMWFAAKWIYAGVLLRKGFNSLGPMAGGGASGGNQFGGRSFSQGKKALRMRNLKMGAGGGLATGALNSIGAFSEGNIGEGIGNIAGGVIGGAIGSLIAPGIGTMIGAQIGAMAGGYLGGLGDKKEEQEPTQQVSMMGDGVIFNPRDKFMKVNDGALIAGTNVNGNKSLAQELMKMNSGVGRGSMPGSMNVSHSDINTRINGTIELRLGGDSKNISGQELLDNPMFMRELNRNIQRETAAAIGGANKVKA